MRFDTVNVPISEMPARFFQNNNKKGSEQMNEVTEMVVAVQPEVEVKPEGEVLVQTAAEVGPEILAQDAGSKTTTAS